MLEYAGRAVVMANASEELLVMAQERGWEVTASNDDDGVALAVEEVLRQNGESSGEEKIADGVVVEFAQ
jgi:hydroxymethylpyrimidine pyrophosphatase-like HAD family hydrolase